jgi:hypothetical protein
VEKKKLISALIIIYVYGVINYSWNDIYNLHPFPGHYVKRHKQRRLNTHGRIIVPVPKLCSITKGIFPFLPQEPSQQRKWGKVFNVERALEREGREAGRGSYRKEEDNIRKRKDDLRADRTREAPK